MYDFTRPIQGLVSITRKDSVIIHFRLDCNDFGVGSNTLCITLAATARGGKQQEREYLND